MKTGKQVEKDSVLDIAGFILCSARTAPKTKGLDNIETILIDDEQTRSKIVEKMRQISKSEHRPSFERDANSIQSVPAIVVIGVKANPAGLNCGYCGYPTCEELKKTKGVCAYNSIDLGLATSSSAIIANKFNVDNRIMFSIGRAALDLGLFEKTSETSPSGKVVQALGIPLSVSGKNPFFDRK